MTRIETRIDSPQCTQCADHEAGADQQNQRQRDFGRDEGSLQSMLEAARTTSSLLHDLLQVGSRRLQCRRKPEDHAKILRKLAGIKEAPKKIEEKKKPEKPKKKGELPSKPEAAATGPVTPPKIEPHRMAPKKSSHASAPAPKPKKKKK